MRIFQGVGVNRNSAIGKAFKYDNNCIVLETKHAAVEVFLDKFDLVRKVAMKQTVTLYERAKKTEIDEAEIFMAHKLTKFLRSLDEN